MSARRPWGGAAAGSWGRAARPTMARECGGANDAATNGRIGSTASSRGRGSRRRPTGTHGGRRGCGPCLSTDWTVFRRKMRSRPCAAPPGLSAPPGHYRRPRARTTVKAASISWGRSSCPRHSPSAGWGTRNTRTTTTQSSWGPRAAPSRRRNGSPTRFCSRRWTGPSAWARRAWSFILPMRRKGRKKRRRSSTWNGTGPSRPSPDRHPPHRHGLVRLRTRQGWPLSLCTTIARARM
mmetsp:Transcript_34495/g.67866  ORF Transcript_34495/g.67866 Transcript_34495/m.67866 type:complete len:237 (-) Transcript_34495:93-803(-)